MGIICGTQSGDIAAGPRSRGRCAAPRSSRSRRSRSPITQPTSVAVVRAAVVPAGLGERLVGGDHRELGEAVGAARLAPAEVIGRLEVAAAPEAVGDPRLAGDPALDQRLGADPERGDGADAGDDDLAAHAQALRDQLDDVVDRLDLVEVGVVELDAVLVLDDLRELDEVERVDVEVLEARVAA